MRRRPVRRPSLFTTTVELTWSLDAHANVETGVVTLVVTNGPLASGAKRLRRFETAAAAETARRLMVAAARPGARVQVA